jgi:energy-coupling factor transport system ATP-binding protein
MRPRVLVLDEPTSQLDPLAADDVLRLLHRLNRQHGLTVLLSEHRLERVAPYVDQVVFLPGCGQSPLSGHPRDVLPTMPFAPPVVQLAATFGWKPVPLCVEQALPRAADLRLLPGQPASRPPSADTVIRCTDVRHAYDHVTALESVALNVRRGEVVALTGKNGSGKTTLLRHLVGLLQPQRGSVEVHGQDTKSVGLERLIEQVGYVPQNPSSLLFADSVLQELEFTRRARRLPVGDCREWLALLGLGELAHRYPRELSVGERQRVALAAILAGEPSTLLLDEPTRGLDPLEKEALAGFLRAQGAEGRTVLLATHDVELAAQCAHRCVVLDSGRVAADGPIAEVMEQLPAYRSQVYALFGHPGLLTIRDVQEARR